MRFVVVPQAVRRVIPPLLNDFIGLQKDTALVASCSGTPRRSARRRSSRPPNFNFTPLLALALMLHRDHDPRRRGSSDWLVAASDQRRRGRPWDGV